MSFSQASLRLPGDTASEGDRNANRNKTLDIGAKDAKTVTYKTALILLSVVLGSALVRKCEKA